VAIKHKKDNKALNYVVLTVAIAEPLMTIPQIYQIWSTRTAAGISLLSWAGYLVAGAIWLAYGLKIRDKPLVASSVLWVISDGLVFLGAMRY
jgi:uncharacterized protein with PQ loop repeat